MLKHLRWAVAALALAACATFDSPPTVYAEEPKQQVNLHEVELVAQMTYCEARGEGDVGMRAVAHVIMNRVADGRWGDTPTEVMSRRAQFTCWRMLPRMSYHGTAWEIARQEALDAVLRLSEDPTLGATHYHAAYVRPSWASRLPRLTRIGLHIFYT